MIGGSFGPKDLPPNGVGIDRPWGYGVAFPAEQLAGAVRVEAVDLVDDGHGREARVGVATVGWS